MKKYEEVRRSTKKYEALGVVYGRYSADCNEFLTIDWQPIYRQTLPVLSKNI
jgi:hypothetical protein